MSNRITPFLWFDNNAEQAAEFYLSTFPDGRRITELRCGKGGPGPEGSILTIAIELAGQEMTFLNGGPAHKLTEAFSFVIRCKTQAEIDGYWEKFLGSGGKELACGWVRDGFGLCWQVVPENIGALLRHPKAMQAMMAMKKLDIAQLEAAGAAQP